MIKEIEPDQEHAQEDAVAYEDAEWAALEIADQEPDAEIADDPRGRDARGVGRPFDAGEAGLENLFHLEQDRTRNDRRGEQKTEARRRFARESGDQAGGDRGAGA